MDNSNCKGIITIKSCIPLGEDKDYIEFEQLCKSNNIDIRLREYELSEPQNSTLIETIQIIIDWLNPIDPDTLCSIKNNLYAIGFMKAIKFLFEKTKTSGIKILQGGKLKDLPQNLLIKNKDNSDCYIRIEHDNINVEKSLERITVNVNTGVFMVEQRNLDEETIDKLFKMFIDSCQTENLQKSEIQEQENPNNDQTQNANS